MKIATIKCDWKGCKNLTNKICLLTNLPDDVLGKIYPSYPTYVKICDAHDVGVVKIPLDFVIDNPNHKPDWAPFKYRCMRCKHVWASYHFHKDSENYGQLPVMCPNAKCGLMNWFKEARMKRAPTKGSGKYGRRAYKETEVYNKVK